MPPHCGRRYPTLVGLGADLDGVSFVQRALKMATHAVLEPYDDRTSTGP